MSTDRDFLLREVFKEYRDSVYRVLEQHDKRIEELTKEAMSLKIKLILVAVASGALSSAGFKFLWGMFP